MEGDTNKEKNACKMENKEGVLDRNVIVFLSTINEWFHIDSEPGKLTNLGQNL